MGEWFVALVQIHDQPPIDSPAKVETHTRVFDANTTMRDVWEWAIGHTDNAGYRTLTQLEIRPDETTQEPGTD